VVGLWLRLVFVVGGAEKFPKEFLRNAWKCHTVGVLSLLSAIRSAQFAKGQTMKTVTAEQLDGGIAIYTGERVAVISPAIGGFRVWGYETSADYMAGDSHGSSMTVPHLTAVALAEGYASGVFDLCNHCCEPVAWVADGDNSAWVHLTPAPECFYSEIWGGK
jgi:hypothetical protein